MSQQPSSRMGSSKRACCAQKRCRHGNEKPVGISSWKKGVIALGLCAALLGLSDDLSAQAKKKADAGPDPAAQAEAELKKNLDPLTEKLTKFMVKIESRLLLSPKEAGDLAELKYQLLDMMNDNPQNALLAKPAYQGGILLSLREEYNDAYELFNFVAKGFPTTSYGLKAKGQIQQLEKRFGPGYFAVESAAADPAATGAAPGTGDPAAAAGTKPADAAVPAAPAKKP